MRILLSNDDGIYARGINLLHDHLSQTHQVTVVAPDRDSSGVSQSLTLHRPLRVRHIDAHRILIDGTPTDCVNMATRGLLPESPDVVISGINHGANLGDDVMYSGTVAAAMEGRFAAPLSIAVSLVGSNHFESAIRVVDQVLAQAQPWNANHGRVLNINVPDLPWNEIKGIKVLELGQRGVGQPIITEQDPRGITRHWIGKAGKGFGVDFEAISDGYAVITPIHTDLTDYQALSAMKDLFQ